MNDHDIMLQAVLVGAGVAVLAVGVGAIIGSGGALAPALAGGMATAVKLLRA